MTTLTLIGIYRVSISQDELRFITESITGSLERTLEEVGRLVLIEIEVRKANKEFDIGLFHQENSNQVAYDEQYFSLDGSLFLGSDRPAGTIDFRVCFFLHYFDIGKQIISPYGCLTPISISDLPSRLNKYCIYEHP